uniref:Uncharacterized protein n=1 Tax=Coccidioides posadasii RMSCC 3488 TaxID=454284 RepID=A0A0J6F979_COCPO|nr:hypothetical protein CPAG_02163 [Coccidioides posadasii RMSCC 3488]
MAALQQASTKYRSMDEWSRLLDRPDDERNCGSEGEVTSGWWIEEFGPQSPTHDRMRERYRRTRASWMGKRREYGQREADTGADEQRQGLWPMPEIEQNLNAYPLQDTDSDQIGKVAIQYRVMMTRFLLRILVSDTNEFVELQRGEGKTENSKSKFGIPDHFSKPQSRV